MNGQAFDKFGWLKALRADARFTAGEVRVLIAVATDYTRRDGVGWLVELDALASATPRPISRNRLCDLLDRAEAFGYLVETARRSAGGRGVKARRAWALATAVDLPKPPPVSEGVSAKPPTVSEGVLNETPTETGKNPNRNGLKPQPEPVNTTPSDQYEYPPPGTSSGTSSGGCAREASPTPEPEKPGNDPPKGQSTIEHKPAPAANGAPRILSLPLPPNHWPDDYPEPEPPRFCDNHPDDTTDKCSPCGNARKKHERWQAARAAWSKDRAAARRTWIDECRECDSEGWFLDRDGLPVDDPAFKCHHAPNWASWWRAQLARPRCAEHVRGPIAYALGCPDCGHAATGGQRRAS